jgi:hypothetical protein
MTWVYCNNQLVDVVQKTGGTETHPAVIVNGLVTRNGRQWLVHPLRIRRPGTTHPCGAIRGQPTHFQQHPRVVRRPAALRRLCPAQGFPVPNRRTANGACCGNSTLPGNTRAAASRPKRKPRTITSLMRMAS